MTRSGMAMVASVQAKVQHVSAHAQLFNIIKDLSFGRKEVTLASGRKSNFYLDMKFTMLNPQGATLLSELVFQRLLKETIVPDYVGGLAMGAVPIVSNVAMYSYQQGRPIPGFFVRKEAKQHGSKRQIEGTASIAGKNVVILDDVTTTGESAMISVNAARQNGANVMLVLSVVDREEGAAKFYADQHIRFDQLFKAGEFLRATE